MMPVKHRVGLPLPKKKGHYEVVYSASLLNHVPAKCSSSKLAFPTHSESPVSSSKVSQLRTSLSSTPCCACLMPLVKSMSMIGMAWALVFEMKKCTVYSKLSCCSSVALGGEYITMMSRSVRSCKRTSTSDDIGSCSILQTKFFRNWFFQNSAMSSIRPACTSVVGLKSTHRSKSPPLALWTRSSPARRLSYELSKARYISNETDVPPKRTTTSTEQAGGCVANVAITTTCLSKSLHACIKL